MLKLKLYGLNVITFNTELIVKGNIPGYTLEKQILQDKLCEISVAIYPTRKYKSIDDKYTSICTELSCNNDKLVAFESEGKMIEYIELDGHKFTVRALYNKFKDKCKVIYECDLIDIKTTKERLQQMVNCDSEYGCDYCIYRRGRYYTFELGEFKARLEVLGEGTTSNKNLEFRLFIATTQIMEEIKKYEEG